MATKAKRKPKVAPGTSVRDLRDKELDDALNRAIADALGEKSKDFEKQLFGESSGVTMDSVLEAKRKLEEQQRSDYDKVLSSTLGKYAHFHSSRDGGMWQTLPSDWHYRQNPYRSKEAQLQAQLSRLRMDLFGVEKERDDLRQRVEFLESLLADYEGEATVDP